MRSDLNYVMLIFYRWWITTSTMVIYSYMIFVQRQLQLNEPVNVILNQGTTIQHGFQTLRANFHIQPKLY